MKKSIRELFFTILILLTFIFAGCPVVKKKELSPPSPEPVMEASPEPAAVIIEAPPPPKPEAEDY